jgi:penicillin-binding protein 1A
MEMVRAYAPFANGGKRVEPHYIVSITSADGRVIYQAEPAKSFQAMDANTANTTLHMMRAVVDSGTASNLRSTYGVRVDLAGKTGTTQNNADGWFVAAAPGVVCGAWVGAASPLVHFRSTSLGQGAATAMPIVASFLRKAESNPVTSPILGKRFPEASAQILLDSHCPMFIESKGKRLFDSLFDKTYREEKRELRQKVREERGQESTQDEDEKEGWMKRMLNKLKKKDK